MNKVMGYKSKALTILNIAFIVMLVITIVLLVSTKFLDFDSIQSYLIVLIFVAWIYLPFREIMQDQKRYDIVLEADKQTLKIRDIKNVQSQIQIRDITKIRVHKFIFCTFGTIAFYTDLRKVSCRYVKNVNDVADKINAQVKNFNSNGIIQTI